MEHLTYQQVLADHYEETGKTVLVVSQEYEDDDIKPHENKEHVELENQEDFQKFGGTRNESGLSPPKHEDKTIYSVTYKTKDTKLNVINIDSKFRSDYLTTQSTNFTFNFGRELKNIISMRISGLEIPNTNYIFMASKYNTSFILTANNVSQTITIPDGNYEDPYDFVERIQEIFDLLFPVEKFKITIGLSTSKITITNETSTIFSMDFTTPLTSRRPYDNSIGFNMGFRDTIYSGETTYTATSIVDTIGSNYLFLSLGEDYPVITQYHNNTMFIAFAKILVDAEKNAILYDNGSNTITKEYFFQQPVNMRSIHIKLYDAHQEIVNLQGMDFSFTLELLEITNHSLYESVRTILHNE
jgi:hypothetical protein